MTDNVNNLNGVPNFGHGLPKVETPVVVTTEDVVTPESVETPTVEATPKVRKKKIT